MNILVRNIYYRKSIIRSISKAYSIREWVVAGSIYPMSYHYTNLKHKHLAKINIRGSIPYLCAFIERRTTSDVSTDC